LTNKLKLLFSILFVLITFDGCLYPKNNFPSNQDTGIDKSAIDLSDKFAKIALKLYMVNDNQKYTIIVSDFVDIETMQTNKIGILFGEHMRVALNNLRDHDVLDLELSDTIQLNRYGTQALSRDTNNFTTEIQEIVVGRYNITDEYIEIFVSRVEPTTKVIKKMESMRIHTKFGVNPLEILSDMVLEHKVFRFASGFLKE
jgi:hypothetical protein